VIDLSHLFRSAKPEIDPQRRTPKPGPGRWQKIVAGLGAAAMLGFLAVFVYGIFIVDHDEELTYRPVPFDLDGAELGLNTVPCWFQPSHTGIDVACYYHVTQQNPGRQEAGRIARAVITLSPIGGDERRRAAAKAAPIVYVEGGPGVGATTDGYRAGRMELLAHVARETGRVTVLQENRGAGNAHPAVDCPQARRALMVMEATPPVRGIAYEIRRWMIECRVMLEAAGLDLRLYSARTMSADLERLRKDMNAQRLSLLGVSYGTVVAQTYAAHHPERVESLVLSGAVPIASEGFVLDIFDVDRAIAAFTTVCSRVSRCTEALLWKRLTELAAERRGQLVLIPARSGIDMAEVPRRVMVFGPDLVTGLANSVSYHGSREEVVALLTDPDRPLREIVTDLVEIVYGAPMDLAFSFPLFEIVLCNDGTPFPVEYAGDLPATLQMPEDLSRLSSSGRPSCEHWEIPDPRGEPRSALPSVPRFPTLLVAGELDANTPPKYAQAVKENLPESRLLLVADGGHDVLFVGGCAVREVIAFLNGNPAAECASGAAH
jgi:pimeloyl-ACP methyl ester carboxylesterase